uniref:Uncharacterized protein n=1 Tax=Arundo donax TaxID=35708 RepID=A0A0A8Z0C9_ARUDO
MHQVNQAQYNHI